MFVHNQSLKASSKNSKVLIRKDEKWGCLGKIYLQILFSFLILNASLAVAQMNLLVTNQGDNSVSAFDEAGAYLGRFVGPGVGGLNQPKSMLLTPSGNLLVASFGNDRVLQYNGFSGQYMSAPIIASTPLRNPWGMVMGNDGLIYVGSSYGYILKYTETGTFMGVAVSLLNNPTDLVFGPNGNIFVVNNNGTTIDQYDSSTGVKVNEFVNLGPAFSSNPVFIAFGPDGDLYVSDYGQNEVKKYNGTTGQYIGPFASGNGLVQPMGIRFGPDGNLYIVSSGNGAILKFDGASGGFIGHFVTPISPYLNSPSHIQFVPASTNVAPIAYVSYDQIVTVSSPVTLDGSASFAPYGRNLTYIWSQIAGPSVTLSLVDPAHPTFIAPATVPNGGVTLTFQLVVNDGVSSSNPVVTNITVKKVNTPPFASAGANQVVASGTVVTLDGSGSYDNEGDYLYYYWEQVSGSSVVLSDSSAVQPTFTAPIVTSGSQSLSFKLWVSDGYVSVEASSPVTVTVQPTNQVPIANAGSAATYVAGAKVHLDGSLSSDPDGNLLTYRWQQTAGPVVTLDMMDPVHPAFSAPKVKTATSLTFKLVVNDGTLDSSPSTVTITVVPANSAPRCNLAQADRYIIWPPNHKMRKVEIKNVFGRFSLNNKGINSSAGNILTITGITQDEPTSGLDGGDNPVDGVINHDSAYVRAERNSTGDGRVYRIAFKAVSNSTLSCTGAVTVCVPVKPGIRGSCKDNGQKYNSLK